MTKTRIKILCLLFVILLQACNMQAQVSPAATPTEKKSTPTPTRIVPSPTKMLATATQTLLPSFTPAPVVSITAVKGNLFIRRGPDMAYNSIGVLYKGTTVDAHARDVLSKWVQIIIPKSTQTGWVSIMTDYSKVEGNVSALPEFKVTDWPVASYVRNCTFHRMFLAPGDIYVDSLFNQPENLVWVYPGVYDVYDIDMPDPVKVDTIETREGITVDLRYTGTGNKRKCP